MFIIFLKNFYTPSPCGDFPYIRGRIQIEILGDSFSLPRETLPPFQGRLSLPSKGDCFSLLRGTQSPLEGRLALHAQPYCTIGPSSSSLPPSPTVSVYAKRLRRGSFSKALLLAANCVATSR